MNNTPDTISLKGGYFYSSAITTSDDSDDRSKEKIKPEVHFNLLIVFGEKPTVQILPDTYSADHVKERMEGSEYVYLRACYDDGELMHLGNVR